MQTDALIPFAAFALFKQLVTVACMTPEVFITKWRAAELKERSAA